MTKYSINLIKFTICLINVNKNYNEFKKENFRSLAYATRKAILKIKGKNYMDLYRSYDDNNFPYIEK